MDFYADFRGAMIALAYFGVPALVIIGIATWRVLRRADRAHRNLQLATIVVATMLFFSVVYYWLFWRTAYGVRVDEESQVLMVYLALPARRREFSFAEIAELREVAGPKLGRRLRLTLNDGRRYFTPTYNDAQAERARDIVRAVNGNARNETVVHHRVTEATEDH